MKEETGQPSGKDPEKSTDRYLNLFHIIDEGFAVCELVRDDSGAGIDYRILEWNPAFEQATVAKADGLTKTYAAVVDTGTAIRFEHDLGHAQRWFEIGAYPMRDDHFALLYKDITERKRREAGAALLNTVNESLLHVEHIDGTMHDLCKKIGDHFGADACAFSETDGPEQSISIRYLWHIQGFTDLPGLQRIAAQMRSAADDTYVNLPFIRDGQWRGSLSLAGHRPHAWRPDELELMGELAFRIWTRLEQVRAEEALKQRERELARVQEIGNIGGVDIDVEHQLVGVRSPEYVRLHGLHPDTKSETHEDWLRRLHPDDRTKAEQTLLKALRGTATGYESEYRIVRPVDGQVRWIYAKLDIERNDEGKPRRLIGVHIDITDRKNAEEALRKSEKQLRALVENLPGGAVFIVDTELRYLLAEGEALGHGGMKSEDFLGKTVAEAVAPELVEGHEANYRKALLGQAFELEHGIGDKTYISRGVPLTNTKGKVYAVLAISYDITERKRAEEALHQSEERYRIALTSADMAAWDWNVPDDTIQWNDQHYYLLGLMPDGQRKEFADFLRFVHPKDSDRIVKALREAVQDTGIFKSEFRIVRTDGTTCWMSGYGRVVEYRDGAAARMVGVMFDITKQKLFTEELSRQVGERTAELQRSNEDLRQFAHVASHDLKEPIRKIKTFNSRVLDEYESELPSKAVGYLEKVAVSTDRMLSMIDGVLRYSKLESTELLLQSVDLNETIRQIGIDLEVLMEQKKAEIGSIGLPTVSASAVLMYQLFYNLVLNALKFARPGVPSRLLLSCEGALIEERYFYRIRLEDNGIGFENEFSEDIFKTFIRLHSVEEYEGTGLGLALCKKIVERHGGTMSAEGRPEEGAIFTILLPVQSSAREGQPAQKTPDRSK